MKRSAAAVATRTDDIAVENHGSIMLIEPLTVVGRHWCEEHLGHAMRFNTAFVVEPRYIEPILQGMVDEGLVIQNV